MINYRKISREMFKSLCKTEYESDHYLLSIQKVHIDIKSRIKIRDDKLGEFLETYRIEQDGEAYYKNPFKYKETVLKLIEHLIAGDISQPVGIDYREDVQIKEGRTAGILSIELKRKYNIKMTPSEIRSLIKKAKSKIKHGPEDHFYVSSL